MGGLGPGIGGSEWFVIGVVALLVVGPERLPGLLRQLGKMVAKARGMANEFRASFDEMARQSELDELRKEVEALRTGQNSPVRLGAEADATFKGIKDEFDKPLFADTPATSCRKRSPSRYDARRVGMARRRTGDDAARHAAFEPRSNRSPPRPRSNARLRRRPKAAPAKAHPRPCRQGSRPKTPAARSTPARLRPGPPPKARAPRNSKLDL
jgi:sec-independent protein translocase protein TatB